MVHHIKKCADCGIYTMKEKCPKCGKKTVSSKPVKYTPFSRLASYRRKALFEERKKRDLL